MKQNVNQIISYNLPSSQLRNLVGYFSDDESPFSLFVFITLHKEELVLFTVQSD